MTYWHPSLINPFKLFPRLVAAAFPPRPTIMALKIALFPPFIRIKKAKDENNYFYFQL